jgi:hypothetical protein
MKPTKQQYTSAFSWSSMDPEKRGKHLSDLHDDHLKNCLEQLTDANLENLYEEFTTKFWSKASAMLAARGRCASSMVTGPANFNSRRNEKANNSSRKRDDEYYYFINEGLKKYIKRNQPKEAPVDQLEFWKSECVRLTQRHAMIKELLPQFRKGLISKKEVEERCNCHVHSFTLAYALKDAKNAKDKLATLERVEAIPAKEKDGTKAYIDTGAGRVCIENATKPSRDIINSYKANGFRWSPSLVRWQAYINPKSLAFIKTLNL